MTHFAAIVAMSENRVIGKNNRLPWHLPADLKHFKNVTMGRPIIMGRKTFESIGRALPGRTNVVVTRDKNFQAPGCVVKHSIDDAIAAVANEETVFIIGGAEIFRETWDRLEKIFLTVIHENIEGDAFFPEINKNEWKEVQRENFEPDEKNAFAYSFITLEKI